MGLDTVVKETTSSIQHSYSLARRRETFSYRAPSTSAYEYIIIEAPHTLQIYCQRLNPKQPHSTKVPINNYPPQCYNIFLAPHCDHHNRRIAPKKVNIPIKIVPPPHHLNEVILFFNSAGQ